MTYSIVARDPESGALGVAVQSHFFSVGSIATFAEAGVGVVCSQAFALRQYGPLGLDLLRTGKGSEETLAALRALDSRRGLRQVGLVAADGRAAAFTGEGCVSHAGHRVEPGVSAQGNMLASGDVWGDMVDAYLASGGDFATRLLDALDAGEAAGGDARGRQSAHLLIVAAERNGQPWDAVLCDVRVDDHPEPLSELRRLAGLRRAYGRLGRVLFEDGPLFADPGRPPPDLETVLAELRELDDELGTRYESRLWRGVLLAKFGRIEEARAELDEPLLNRPSVRVFLEGVVESGLIPQSVVDAEVTAVVVP